MNSVQDLYGDRSHGERRERREELERGIYESEVVGGDETGGVARSRVEVTKVGESRCSGTR